MNAIKKYNEHDRLFLKLRILFAGWKPEREDEDCQSSEQYFMTSILYKAFKFVIDLREMRKQYESLRDEEEVKGKLKSLMKEITENVTYNKDAKRITLIELNAMADQIKTFSLYESLIQKEESGIFTNLADFLDIGEEIKRNHLKKANELLPQIFLNLINKNMTKDLLQIDLEETRRINNLIYNQVNKKIHIVENAYDFYQNYFDKLEEQISSL